jgi:DHA2 family multidrug resistance protein
MDYPVITIGFAMAPRGIGTMAAMIVCGRLVERIDPRLLLICGLLITAGSLWMMIRFSPLMGMQPVIVAGLVQGFGLGCIFVPMSTITFATLPPALRNEGASLYSLTRNLGASVGISVCTTLLSRNIQLMHTRLGDLVTPYSLSQWAARLPELGLDTPEGAALLNGMVNRQAAMIAYLNDFMLMFWVTLAAIPLLLVLRRPPRLRSAPAPSSSAVD